VMEEKSGAGVRSAVMIRVKDVDADFEHAERNGAKIVREPRDYPYGARQYNAEDFAGHHWCFSQSIADVDLRDWGGTRGELQSNGCCFFLEGGKCL